MLKHQIEVNLPQNSYPIYIGENLLENEEIITRHISNNKIMIVTNQSIAKIYLPQLQKTLKNHVYNYIILPDGENYKTLTTWEKILNSLAENKYHRDSIIVTLGGGVIGDMGGFAAACYQRGIPFIQIPTTLLAQVDASIGGKTAVNHNLGKNYIGAFHQPNAVIIDIATLNTLPKREFNSGLAEIVKAALIKDSNFFIWLEENYAAIMQKEKSALSKAILRACEIKRDFVIADEKENGIRAHLNLGHTFGHAIERALNYGTWLHGEAVATGIVLAAKLSKQYNLISQQDCDRITNLLHKMDLPTQIPKNITLNDLLESIRGDKKVKKDQLCFILLNGIGSASINNLVSEQDLKLLKI